jgi:hypothetical protein
VNDYLRVRVVRPPIVAVASEAGGQSLSYGAVTNDSVHGFSLVETGKAGLPESKPAAT